MPGDASPGWQNATIRSVLQATPSIKVFAFRLAHPVGFVPGQHADVRLTAPDGYQAIRSYSITALRDRGFELELAIERLPDGEVSSFFHDVATGGDEIELRASLGGHFILTPETPSPALLIAAGSGVAPFIAMLRDHGRRTPTGPIALLVSARSEEDVLFRDELTALDQSDAAVSVRFTLTRARPRRSIDFSGRINADTVRSVMATLPAPPGSIFICGSNDFVNAATDLLATERTDPSIIRTERYGG